MKLALPFTITNNSFSIRHSQTVDISIISIQKQMQQLLWALVITLLNCFQTGQYWSIQSKLAKDLVLNISTAVKNSSLRRGLYDCPLYGSCTIRSAFTL